MLMIEDEQHFYRFLSINSQEISTKKRTNSSFSKKICFFFVVVETIELPLSLTGEQDSSINRS